MDTPVEVFKQSSSASFTDCLSLGKKLAILNNQNKLQIDSSIKIAILSSSSMNGVSDVLVAQCSSFNVFPNIYTAEYGQYAQEILNSESYLYSFNPDLIIVNIDLKAIAESYELLPYKKSTEERGEEKTNGKAKKGETRETKKGGSGERERVRKNSNLPKADNKRSISWMISFIHDPFHSLKLPPRYLGCRCCDCLRCCCHGN